MHLQRLTGLVAAAVATMMMGASVSASRGSFEVVHVRSIGGGPLPGLMKAPRGVAIDPDNGRIFVTDSGYCRVQVFDPHGRFLKMWGTCGAGPGQLGSAAGIAFDRSGLVYVVDATNARIQAFTRDGGFVRAWGSKGTAVGQFRQPAGIAIDREDRVFVADSYNYRVQVFTTAGEFVRTWGSKGGGNGQFVRDWFPNEDTDGPYGVAIGGDGLIYVTSPWDSRVQVFTKTGEFVRAWRAGNTPTGIALDAHDMVTVTNAGWKMNINVTGIAKFTAAGACVRRWSGDGIGPGQFEGTSAVAIDASGNVYVADTENNRVQKFNADGMWVTQWGSNGDGLLRGPSDVALDREGQVYVVDAQNKRIQKFSADGAFAAKFGQEWPSVGGGRFTTNPLRLAVDREGAVYVEDLLSDRIQVFSATGVILRMWTPPDRVRATPRLRGVKVGPAGDLFRMKDNQVVKFDAAGRPVAVYKGTRDAYLIDFALDGRGNIYLAEAQEDQKWSRIRVLSPHGEEIARFPSVGPGDGNYLKTSRIAIDSQDRVYVVQQSHCKIEVFDNRGAFLGRWGSCGYADGEFEEPSGIAVDDRGRVYVADYGNNRVQVFRVREI